MKSFVKRRERRKRITSTTISIFAIIVLIALCAKFTNLTVVLWYFSWALIFGVLWKKIGKKSFIAFIPVVRWFYLFLAVNQTPILIVFCIIPFVNIIGIPKVLWILCKAYYKKIKAKATQK